MLKKVDFCASVHDCRPRAERRPNEVMKPGGDQDAFKEGIEPDAERAAGEDKALRGGNVLLVAMVLDEPDFHDDEIHQQGFIGLTARVDAEREGDGRYVDIFCV